VNRTTNTKATKSDINGILVVDKPSNMTSHDVVNYVRRHFKVKKVGHAGTLDPMATGVLVMLIGKSTKLSERFTRDDKEYESTLTLGARTVSGDKEGKVISGGEWIDIDEAKIRSTFGLFEGEIMQVPPMVSAKSHKGKRLYKLAWRGVEVEREPKKVNIKHLVIEKIDMPNIFFRMECSKGTYVRQICDDIGEKLGCGGHASSVRRIRSGIFKIEDARTMSEVKAMDAESLKRTVITPKNL